MPTYQQRHWKVSSDDTRQRWPNKYLKANAPACTTGHCGLDSAIMTTQRSHTSDDATQPCNAPHGRYGLDSAIMTTQCSQPSDDATQPRNAPARHGDDDSPTCTQRRHDECGPIRGYQALLYAYARHACNHHAQPQQQRQPNLHPACTTASHSLTSMVPSWVSSSVICPCTTCMQPPHATTTTTARHSPNMPQHVQQRAVV
ncbi:hypothetical protein BU15DRAFT_65936 [Melanogaster broomeanus]|nr:hypothetical protein BU15DRAFT_65936 [Melanogaster broomeanus]